MGSLCIETCLCVGHDLDPGVAGHFDSQARGSYDLGTGAAERRAGRPAPLSDPGQVADGIVAASPRPSRGDGEYAPEVDLGLRSVPLRSRDGLWVEGKGAPKSSDMLQLTTSRGKL